MFSLHLALVIVSCLVCVISHFIVLVISESVANLSCAIISLAVVSPINLYHLCLLLFCSPTLIICESHHQMVRQRQNHHLMFPRHQVFQKVSASFALIRGWKRSERSNTCTTRFRKAHRKRSPSSLQTIPVIMPKPWHPLQPISRPNAASRVRSTIRPIASATSPFRPSAGTRASPPLPPPLLLSSPTRGHPGTSISPLGNC